MSIVGSRTLSIGRGSIVFLGSSYQLNFDFLSAPVLPVGAALTRASIGRYFNSSLSLTSAAIDVARWTYDPSSGALLGLLVEPAASSGVFNASGSDVVAGSPGTQPSSWVVTASNNSVTRTFGAATTEDGIPAVDTTFAGTPSASSTKTWQLDLDTHIPAVMGQSGVISLFVGIRSGGLTNTTLKLGIRELDGLGSTAPAQEVVIVPTSAALKTQRFSAPFTIVNANTAFLRPQLVMTITLGQAVNLGLRTGLANVDFASAVSSPIISTSAAVTRAADILTLPIASGTYSIDITRVSGVTHLTGVVVTGDSYTVPTDASPLQRVTAWRTA